jgi:AcrR family transcriptional regulator
MGIGVYGIMAKVTEADIFQVAREVLAEKGFEKARLTDVARGLDITPAALYKHFSNKENLFETLNDQWLNSVDAPAIAAAGRASEGTRVTALHDWLWQLVTGRRNAYQAEPVQMAFYEERLGKNDELINPRVAEFARAVELIMAWDTFRNQRGMTIMLALTYFYHPFFADKWDDSLFQPLFESTWLELLPIVRQGLTED